MNRFPLYLLAHNVRSLHNVGAFFRTADAFGVSGIFLSGFSGTPKNPKLAKVSLGAEQQIPWEHFKTAGQAINALRSKVPGLTVCALENRTKQKIVPLNAYVPKGPMLLVVGNEVKGMSKALLSLCDYILEIPMLGSKESLNVSVAAGIALYYLRFKCLGAAIAVGVA